MNATVAKVLTPLVVWGLSLACPVVPAMEWQALVGAILSGDISLQHLTEFMAAHNIKIYSSDADFPQQVKSGGV